jgi:predicted porin
MQKKLLGVAVATALAAPGLVFAQSAVQVYGTVHMSASRIKFGSDTLGNPSQSKFDVNSHSSNWGLRSTETLGGGMTAWFQAEFNMPMLRENGTGNTAGTSRNSGVGLRGAFGNVYYGTWETPWAQTFRLWDVGTIGGYGPNTSVIGRRETTNVGRTYNCTGSLGVTADGGNVASPTAATVCNNAAAGAPALGGAGTGAGANLGYPLWRRYMQSIFYESPVFAGVQVKVAYLPNENKSDYGTSSATAPSNAIGTTVGINSNPSSWSGSLTWTGLGGRARAFAATMRSKEWS